MAGRTKDRGAGGYNPIYGMSVLLLTSRCEEGKARLPTGLSFGVHPQSRTPDDDKSTLNSQGAPPRRRSRPVSSMATFFTRRLGLTMGGSFLVGAGIELFMIKTGFCACTCAPSRARARAAYAAPHRPSLRVSRARARAALPCARGRCNRHGEGGRALRRARRPAPRAPPTNAGAAGCAEAGLSNCPSVGVKDSGRSDQ